MKQSSRGFFDWPTQGFSSNIDFMGSSQFEEPGIFAPEKMAAHTKCGLNGNRWPCKCTFKKTPCSVG